MATTKQCTVCNMERSLHDFRAVYNKIDGKSAKTGVRNKCKYCEKKTTEESKKAKNIDTNQVKKPEKCIKCERSGSEVDFPWRDKEHTVYRNTCKDCHGSRNEKSTDMKLCDVCKEEKSALNDFDKGRRICKKCYTNSRKENHKEFQKTNEFKNRDFKPPEKKICIECEQEYDDVDSNFSRRTDTKTPTWKGICKICVNLKAFHIPYRERKREEDEEGWLAHNAAVMNRYRNFDTRSKLICIKNEAKLRNISVEDDEILKIKMCQACHYCGYEPQENEYLNGLDRVDPSKHYCDSNTVPCCFTCNTMKGVLSIDVFLNQVRKIYEYRKEDIHTSSTKDRIYFNKLNPKKVNNLSIIEKFRIWNKSCYLCGRTPCFGIDRENPKEDYSIENSKPCCSECNFMKKDANIDDFLGYIKKLFNYTSSWLIKDIDDELIRIGANKLRYPVKLSFKEHSVIFPSYSIAKKSLSTSQLKQCKITDASNKEFRDQNKQDILINFFNSL